MLAVVRRAKVRTNRKLSSITNWVVLDRVEAAFEVANNLFVILLNEKSQTHSVSGLGLRSCFLVTSNHIQLTPLCTIPYWKYGHKLQELNWNKYSSTATVIR